MTPFQRTLATPVLTTLAALALVACGGGGDDGGTATPTTTNNNPPVTVTDNPPPSTTVSVTGGQVQAEANRSYRIEAPATAPVEIVLPAALAMGDRITVTGVGAAAWRITQNSGQSILTDLLPSDPALGVRWLESTTASHWWTAAASGDGRLLAMAANSGQIHVSRDEGASWQAVTGLPASNWSSIDMDRTGTFIVATNFVGGVWYSGDSGATWSSIAPAWTPPTGAAQWLGITISDDGQRLALVSKGGPVFTSTDGGGSWTERMANADWQGIAGSADGQILLTAATDGRLQVSANGGETWTPYEASRHWYRFAVSADGQRMAAADSAGALHLSTNAGASWSPVLAHSPITEVSMSRDGLTLAVSVAAVTGGEAGGVYQSTDGGLNWQQVRDAGVWRAAALSGDGRTLVAGTLGDGLFPWVIPQPTDPVGRIYVSRGHRTAYGAAGGLTGAQGDMVELVYLGNGRFEVTHSEGAPAAAP